MFSELELSLGSKERWQTRQQAELLQNWGGMFEKFELLSGGVKRSRGNSLALQTQNFSYADPFLLDRLLEIERKCYLFHTLPT